MIQSPETGPGDTTTPPGDAKATGRSPGGGRRVQRTVNFDRDTLERARAAAAHLARHEPGAGIHSLADIVNLAVAERVVELERRFNGGEPFQPVFRLQPGRRAGQSAGGPAEPAVGPSVAPAAAPAVLLAAPGEPAEQEPADLDAVTLLAPAHPTSRNEPDLT